MKKIIAILGTLAIFVSAVSAESLTLTEEQKTALEEAISPKKTESRELISGAFDDVTDLLSDVISENSSLLGAQPDAFIGKLFPSIPVHFTAGLSFSGTFINTEEFTDAVQDLANGIQNTYNPTSADENIFSIDFDLPSHLPMPTAAFNLRLGGIFLPFDLGIYGITTFNDTIKDISVDDFNFGLNYTTFGVDFRYEVYKGSTFLPKISAGIGYIYSNLDFDFSMSKEVEDLKIAGIPIKDAVLNSDISLSSTTHTLFAQVQASKKLLVFEPYIGLKLFMSRVQNKYDWQYNTTANELYTPITDLLEDSDSSDSTTDFGADTIATQFFGGLGITLAKFQMTFNGAYNAKTNYWSVGLGFNFKN